VGEGEDEEDEDEEVKDLDYLFRNDV